MINPHHITQACRRTQDALLIATEKPSPKPQNGGGGGSSIEPPMPLPVGLISAKRELADWLTDWCSLVRDGLQIVATYDLDEHSRLEWLGTGERAEFLAGHEAGMDFLEEITALTKQLENPYLGRVEKTFLGLHKGEEVHIRKGQTLVELADGSTEHVESIKAWNRDYVRLAEGTAKEVSEMIWEFFGEYIKPRLIADTRNNDANPRTKREPKLASIRKDGRDHIYRVQDVLTRLSQENISEKS